MNSSEIDNDKIQIYIETINKHIINTEIKIEEIPTINNLYYFIYKEIQSLDIDILDILNCSIYVSVEKEKKNLNIQNLDFIREKKILISNQEEYLSILNNLGKDHKLNVKLKQNNNKSELELQYAYIFIDIFKYFEKSEKQLHNESIINNISVYKQLIEFYEEKYWKFDSLIHDNGEKNNKIVYYIINFIGTNSKRCIFYDE
jgi:hypothetical protein